MVMDSYGGLVAAIEYIFVKFVFRQSTRLQETVNKSY